MGKRFPQQFDEDLGVNDEDLVFIADSNDSNKSKKMKIGTLLSGVYTSISNLLTNKADKSNVLEKDNAITYTPTNAYNPATKKYIDDINTIIRGLLDPHLIDYANPHNVTKSQVGLSNVDNTSDLEKPISTATQTALDNKADLDETGKVPASQLPSYVDDILEYPDYASLPITGESGKIYVTTDNNLQYRWGGSSYVEISSSLALGETISTAYRGDRGKIAYDHSQLTSGNPHNVTKSDVGLSNVDNTADIDKPVSTPVFNALELKATQFVGICAETPITANDISIDYVNRILTINPPLGYFHFFTDGGGVITKHEKVGAVNFPAFTDTSGVWYFHFDTNGDPIATQTPWSSFDTVCTVYRLAWNATLSGSAKSAVESWECHLNTISSADHAWKHRYGTIWENGFTAVHNRITSGTPNADGRNTCFSLTTGTNMDDNMPYTVTNDTGASKFMQDMGQINAGLLTFSNAGLFRVRTQDAGGLLDALPATRFPFAWNSGSNRPEYITSAGARTLVGNGNFFVYFAYSIQDPRNGETIKLVSTGSEYITLANAQASTWEDVKALYPLIGDPEIRPLYKLIFEYRNTYDVAVKYSALRQVDDYRKTIVTTTATSAGSTTATSVSFIPYGNLVSTNAQSAIQELDDEKLSKAVGGEINAMTAKTTPVDADIALIEDSADTFNKKKVTWSNIKATLKTYFDTLYGGTMNKATGAEINAGVDDSKYVTSKGIADSNLSYTDGSETLTNKTINLSSNTLVMTLAQLNTAVSDADVASIAGAETLTNKRITARVGTETSNGTPSINTDSYDAWSITALATAITSVTVTGTPTNFQKLIVRIKDNGTIRAISWGASFEARGVALPTTTVASKVLTVGFIYDTVTSKWGCVASA